MGSTPPRVAVIGVNGHGASHARTLAAAHQAGRLTFAAVCDVAPPTPTVAALLPAGVTVVNDYRDLARLDLDATVICTPPHTHLEIATAVARAGSDILLEKPPVLSLAEHEALQAVLTETGRVCQVGFQSLASPALAALRQAIADGRLGEVDLVVSTGAWIREDSYYARARWAGQRELDGYPVADGALVNPFAHALMNCLLLAGPDNWPVQMELERYRARAQIEVDDTACLRVTLASGKRILVAVTLCAERFSPARITVRGAARQAVFDYADDLLQLPGDNALRPVAGRPTLIDNLLAHRASPQTTPLLAPLALTAPFTALAEAILAAPIPPLLTGDTVTVVPTDSSQRVQINGINALIAQAGQQGALFSELGAAWATRPYLTPVAAPPASLTFDVGAPIHPRDSSAVPRP